MSAYIASDKVRLKRVYELTGTDDGCRVLVDRLWPRGVTTAEAAVDLWMKELAPSTQLRKWFGHDATRWREFRRRYKLEVREHGDQLEKLCALARKGPITLVYAAHDETHNEAVVLRDLILGHKTRR